MTPKEEWRFRQLQSPNVDISFITESHGINWPPDDQFIHDITYQEWGGFEKQLEPGKVHRHGFELFLHNQGLLTRKYAAASLGMEPESLDQLLPRLPELALSKKYEVYPGIIWGCLSSDLSGAFSPDTLGPCSCSSFDRWCRRLHEIIFDKLGLRIRKLFCSDKMEAYATTWDCISLCPLRYEDVVFMDFKKPFTLSPDVCSAQYVYENWQILTSYVHGRPNGKKRT